MGHEEIVSFRGITTGISMEGSQTVVTVWLLGLLPSFEVYAHKRIFSSCLK